MTKKVTKHNWWKTQFNKDYYKTYLHELTEERTREEVSFIVSAAKIKKTDLILDVGCGQGRHTIELSGRGYAITGFDYSEFLLQKAKKRAQMLKQRIKFIKGDIRELTFHDRFDVIISIFTSLGYFSDKENDLILDNIHRALKPGGKLLLDVINAEPLFREIVNEGITIKPHVFRRVINKYSDGYKFIDTDTYYKNTQLIHLQRRWFKKGQKGIYHYYITHYTANQYKQSLKKHNFKLIKTWGDYKGSAWSKTSSRTIMLVKKTNPHMPADFIKNIFNRLF